MNEHYCQVPVTVIEAMIQLSERINIDILSVATQQDLSDPNTHFYSMKYAIDELVLLGIITH